MTDFHMKHSTAKRVPKHLAPTHPPSSGSASQTKPLSSFLSARVSFSFPFSNALQYDQGGIVISFRPRPAASAAETSAPPPKWIKTGVEFYNSAPRVSTVACDAWADWSVGDRSPDGSQEGADGAKIWTTVAIEKATDHHGPSLWVYRVTADGKKEPLREICCVYAGGEEETSKWELTVQAFAARPEQEAKSGLEVEFRDFEVDWEA